MSDADATASVLRPHDRRELAAMVAESRSLRAVGGGSKPPLSRAEAPETRLDLGALSGVIRYEPSEYTFTALAGTPIVEIDETLAEHGQYLPFDPLRAESGATLGGVVATATNGPGRLRYGGVRDFILAVALVDGRGEEIRGGAPVVKNAAGFDLPKLMVGSLGELGILVELTFKVFPRPRAARTLEVRGPGSSVSAAYARLLEGGRELDALELDLGPEPRLWLRLAGEPEALDALARRWGDFLLAAAPDLEVSLVEDDGDLWRDARELAWAGSEGSVFAIPTTPGRWHEMDRDLHRLEGVTMPSLDGPAQWPRRSTAGGHRLLVAVDPAEEPAFDRWLTDQGRTALALVGPTRRRRLGSRRSNPFLARVRRALDPRSVFAASGDPVAAGSV
jgi:glycolate oxidase FAD binding subunit